MRRTQLNKVLAGFMVFALLSIMMISSANASFPNPVGFVNDFAGVLDQRSEAEIEVVAEQLQKEQGIELAVVTVQSTAPLDPKAYTTELFEEWGIGGPEDSGLLVVLSMQERAIEVEPGYGLEGALPDGKIGALLDQAAMPYLADGDYGRGLSALAQAFQAELSGEGFAAAESDESESTDWFVAFIIFILIAMLLRRNRFYPPGGMGGSGGSGGSRTIRRGRTVVIPGRLPRSGGRGGFGGGGFGGFGGGRSGGGGAGRRF